MREGGSGVPAVAPRVPQGGPVDLTLYHWFYSGLAGSLRAHALGQGHEIPVGGVPLTTPVITAAGGKLIPTAAAHAETDLLVQFRKVMGSLDAMYDPRTGLAVTRRARAAEL